MIYGQVSSSSTYQKALSLEAKVEGNMAAYRFSASAAYQSVQKGTESLNKVYIESIAKCIMYRVQMKPVFKVSSTFADQVSMT
jgi:hypothetical protein